MDKKLAIIICNYNKVEYVLQCIDSVLGQTLQDFDIYVVDNASSDCSVARINEIYKDKVILLKNKQNLGGSGGFNTGIRAACKKDYKNLMLVDNDIVMDREAVQKLWDFLEHNVSVGIAGSKIMKMDAPDRIQEFGAEINFDNFGFRPLFAGCRDSTELPEIQYCDYVPACSLMIRREVVDKIGCMPEENFIYWDDIEWGYKAKLSGYQVAVYGNSKVWHKGGGNVATTTFNNYYWYRNKTKFFINNHPDIHKKETRRALVKEVFQGIYGCYYAKRFQRMKTIADALTDALEKRMGKALPERIRIEDSYEDRFKKLLLDKNSITLKVRKQWKSTERIVARIRLIKPKIQIVLLVDDILPEWKELFKDCFLKKVNDRNDKDVYSVCEHIFTIREKKFTTCYIDSWCNLILNEEELRQCREFESIFDIFYRLYEDRILE